MFLADKLNKGGSLSTPDAQFNYVTMLLHGDGTNGAQNNTFLDSSTNNFTITRNGNTTQGSFSPYGDNWSNYFDGSTSYLSVPSSSALAFGTGDFTVEFWVNYASDSASYVFYDGRGTSVSQTGFTIYMSAGTLYAQKGLSSLVTATTPTANTWHHIAFSRSGSSNKLFVDGTQVGSTATDSTNYSTAYSVGIGSTLDSSYTSSYDLVGYMSNVRVVKGTAVYTSNFTPSTTPLTAITNTSLLTCQSNRFIDNSSNAFAITVGGTPSVQRFNPFGASTAYSTSVIGGSGYFDGSGDYLTWPSGSSVAFGTGNFTVECWVYLGATPTTNFLFDFRDASNTTAPAFIWGNTNSGVLDWTQNAASGPNVTSTGATWNINTWYHIAYVRNGTTGTIYQNGVSIGSGTDNTNYTVTPTTSTIGARYGSPFYEFNGYISDVRIVKGTAVYTGAFTPPTSPLTAISNTQLLTSMTNGAIYDNAMMNDLETVGNAQISTSVKKYGTGSLAFDETGDYITVPPSPNMSLGTGDFTIECWARFAANPVGNGQGLYQLANGYLNNTIRGPACGVETSTGNWTIYYGTTYTTAAIVPTTGVWYHTAFVRSSGTSKLYIDGTSIISVADTTNYTDQYFTIGGYYDTAFLLNGYIDDLRITKGYARYTSTFTPPTKALSDTGP